MGGKSTLLRSTCVGVLMAQVGCYVAASSALLAPVDAIYTRIGESSDCVCVYVGLDVIRACWHWERCH